MAWGGDYTGGMRPPKTLEDYFSDPRFPPVVTEPAPIDTTPTVGPIVTGVDPTEIHNVLYGRVIPLSALGLARIGTAGLLFGPYFTAGLASFAVSFGFPANPAGTRRIYEVALDGKVAWELAAGSPAGALDAAGFIGDSFTCRFYGGTQTQAADPLEIAKFGDEAVAYRPHMMLWFENLDVEQFDGKVPFVSVKIGDVTDGAVPGDGINLGEALERFAYSPWIEYSSSTFETTGVADIIGAMILTEDQSFLDLLRVTARVYRTLDILQTDKLRINDRGSSVAPDLVLNRDRIAAAGGVQFSRREEASVPRELELITIDPDADYLFMGSKAARPLAPVPVSASVAKDTITLPVVIGATTRASLVTFAKYAEDHARKRISLQTMLAGYALEPGDLFRLDKLLLERFQTSPSDNRWYWRTADAGFDPSEIYKVVETSHGANFINEIVAEPILKCAIYFDPTTDPYYLDNIVHLHADSDTPIVDNSQYGRAWEFVGTATLDTTVKKFGEASFRFDGVNAYAATSYNFHAEWDFSPTNTSPFTIELWARFDEVPLSSNHQTLICRNGGFIFQCWHLLVAAGWTDIHFMSAPNGINPLSVKVNTTGANLQPDTWYHIAVDKDSTGKLRIYVDGVMKGSNTPANSSLKHFLCEISVGSDSGSLENFPFKGNIDEVRITARSRYGDVYGDASFPVPTEPFPDHA